jgi:hypothetical protein
LRSAHRVALAGLLILAALAGTADAALLEPVTVNASGPEIAEVGKPFGLELSVAAEPGALDIAAAPLTLGVKLAPECGGSRAGTPGKAVLERTLPNPTAGAAYSQTISAQVTAPTAGTDVICAFLQDSQERQFATSTEAEVTVVSPGAAAACRSATSKSKAATRKLKHLTARIERTRSKLRHSQGAAHKKQSHQLKHLRTQKRKASKQSKKLAKRTAAACS